MPTFYLDGEPVEFEPGENVLAAALRSGREIPHYCYHPALKVTAQCRMCLVDVVDMGNGRGMPKLQTSCSTPISEGMKVETKSEKVKHSQNLVGEFLLVNHPLDCPICDQAGECELQNISFTYGTGQSEMEYEKRVYGWRDVGTFIMLERNRCIHCSRCERFTRDVTGTHDFGTFLRSHELTFDTFEDHQITDKFQGNLADLCPVGCILNRDWRFRKRAWKLVKTPSVCPSCSTGCNITVEHHKNRVYRLKPRENQQVNRWWMCDEGRIGFHDLNDRNNRVLEPQARVGGNLHSAKWAAVYAAVAQRVREIGASGAKVLGLADTQAGNEELYLFKKLLRDGLGAETVYFPLRESQQETQPPREGFDPFIYTLITTDKSPNTAGARALGLTGDLDDNRLKDAAKGVKVAVILGNPLPDDAATIKVVAKAELIVLIGAFHGPWSEVADVILAGRTYAEKAGTFTNKAGRVQVFQPAIRPPDDTRPEVEILQELMAALGKAPEGMGDTAAVFDVIGLEEAPFKGLTWAQLDSLGTVLPGKTD